MTFLFQIGKLLSQPDLPMRGQRQSLELHPNVFAEGTAANAVYLIFLKNPYFVHGPATCM